MITVNNKEYPWKEGTDLYNIFAAVGYTLKKPSVLVRVNNEIIRKDRWDTYIVQDRSLIDIVNLLRGG